MAKGSGSRKKSTSNSPKGISGRTLTSEEYAESLFKRGLISVDPGDAAFAPASSLFSRQISEAIENNTDYLVVGKDNSKITLIGKDDDMKENIKNYGTDYASYSLVGKTLIDVINDINSKKKYQIYEG